MRRRGKAEEEVPDAGVRRKKLVVKEAVKMRCLPHTPTHPLILTHAPTRLRECCAVAHDEGCGRGRVQRTTGPRTVGAAERQTMSATLAARGPGARVRLACCAYGAPTATRGLRCVLPRNPSLWRRARHTLALCGGEKLTLRGYVCKSAHRSSSALQRSLCLLLDILKMSTTRHLPCMHHRCRGCGWRARVLPL